MPFGKWENFSACIVDMQGPPNNYDEETAKKVCGKLQARLEGKEVFKILKSKSGRRIIAQYVHVEGLDREGDIIPLTRTKEALEDLKSRDPRTHNIMWRHSSYQIGWPLWTFTDEDGRLHKTEVDEYGLWGITEVRSDGYQKADEVWNRILRGEPMGASVGVTSPDGRMVPLILTKQEIAKRRLRKDWLGARYWDIPLQFIEPWSLTQTPANQYVTNVAILQKEGTPKTDEERAKAHFNISNEDWNKLTPEEKQAYIDKLPPRTTGLSKQDEKPPKAWWDACMASVSGTDKAAVCGHIFHHVLGGDRSKADPSMFKAMSWEECIAQAKKRGARDPEALCGWLKAHGPKKQLKQHECPEGKHWDEDEEECVPDEITKSFMPEGETLIQNLLRSKHV